MIVHVVVGQISMLWWVGEHVIVELVWMMVMV